MADVLRSISGLLTPGVIQRAAALVGESPGDTQRALEKRVVPVHLARLAALGSFAAGTSHLRELVDRAATARNPPGDLGRLFTGGETTQAALRAGREQVQALFGNDLDAVTAEVAESSGIRISSASTLLTLTAPLALSMVANDTRGMDTAGLVKFLAGERREVERLLTPGLRNLMRDEAPARPVARRAEVAPAAWWTRAVAVLLPVLLGIVGLFIWAPWRFEPPPVRPPEVKKRVARLALPDGAALDVPEGSFNHELARYLADASATAPRTFVFEGLAFQSGRSTLEADSQPLVAELAAILKAFPAAEVRLEGHTDDVGNPDANQRLSLERAETVRAGLVASGVERRRLDAAGFGQERPVTSNASEAGKAQNRRTELVVTRK